LRALRLPDRLRPRLARPTFGKLFEGSEPFTTAKQVAAYLRECGRVIGVGDVICQTLEVVGTVPHVCIIDGRTRRRFSGYWVSEENFDKIISVMNPRSHITEEAYEAIEEAIRAAGEGKKTLILVDGEEDLLALPAFAEAPKGYCVVFGVPGKGVMVIEVDDEVKELARKILAEFEEVIV